DVEEMVLAFPTSERYQFGLSDPAKSAVDYIDQGTLCIHLGHFTRGLRLPLPHLVTRQWKPLPACSTQFLLFRRNPGRRDSVLLNRKLGLNLFKICLRLPTFGRGSSLPYAAGTDLMSILLCTGMQHPGSGSTSEIPGNNWLVDRENATTMLLIVRHDWVQAADNDDEAAAEEEFHQAGSWKLNGFWDEPE
ncbi:hypothetical protein Dimus_020720, partial [Dionaea muscipula]